VLKEFTGLTDDEISDLYVRGGITTDADYPFQGIPKTVCL